MRFKEGNKILWGQDFAYYIGIPSDIVFKIIRVTYTGNMLTIKMKGPEYGDIPYGKGAIFIYLKNFSILEQELQEI